MIFRSQAFLWVWVINLKRNVIHMFYSALRFYLDVFAMWSVIFDIKIKNILKLFWCNILILILTISSWKFDIVMNTVGKM